MGARGVKGPKWLLPGYPRGAGYLPNILIMDQRLTGQGIKKQNKKISKKKITGIIPAWKEKKSFNFFFKSTNPHKNCDKTKKYRILLYRINSMINYLLHYT